MGDLSYLIYQLLLLNKISIDKQELFFQIKSHPSYPSLHAVNGVLTHFNIDNLALHIPNTKETLDQLPKSFLAQIHTNHGEEFVVASKHDLNYTLLHSDHKKKNVSIDAFLNQFTGIIVAVEKTALVEETKTYTNFFSHALLGVFFVLVFSLLILSKPSILATLFFILSSLGAFIGLTLKKQEQGVTSVLGDVFCSGVSEFKECNAVLSSKGAQVFGYFKLSDLSMIYFSGLALSVFLLILYGENLALPYIASFIALPITLYSIYYQYAVVKAWCFLCLSVVAIIWMQAVLAVIDFGSINTTSFSLFATVVFTFGLIAALILWNSLAPKLNDLKDLKDHKLESIRFKRNFNLFNTLLNQSKSVNTHIRDTPEIVFGNHESPLQITIITNPFCGHCKSVHTLVEDILKKHEEAVKITIRFCITLKDNESDLVKITCRLLELYHEESKDQCLDAMHDIYGGMSPELWLTKFGTVQNKDYKHILYEENKWCEDHNINFTPEILINGKSFPKEYDRSDLLFFIEDLNENCGITPQEEIVNATH